MIYLNILFTLYLVSWNINLGSCSEKYNKYWVHNSLEEGLTTEDSRKNQLKLRQEMNDLLPEEFKKHRIHKELSKEYQTNTAAELEPRIHKLHKPQKNDTKSTHEKDFLKYKNQSVDTTLRDYDKQYHKRTTKQKFKKKKLEKESIKPKVDEPKLKHKDLEPKAAKDGLTKIMSSELILFARDLFNAYKNSTIVSSKNASKLPKQSYELVEDDETVITNHSNEDKQTELVNKEKTTVKWKKYTKESFRGRTDGQLQRNRDKFNKRYESEPEDNYHTRDNDPTSVGYYNKGYRGKSKAESYEKSAVTRNRYLEKSSEFSKNHEEVVVKSSELSKNYDIVEKKSTENFKNYDKMEKKSSEFSKPIENVEKKSFGFSKHYNKVDKKYHLRERKPRPSRFDVKSNRPHKERKRKHKKERAKTKEIEREGKTYYKNIRSTIMDSDETNDGETSTTPRGPYPNKLSPFYIAKQVKYYLNECSNRKGNMNATLEVLDKTVSYYDIVLVKMTDIKDDEAMNFRTQSKYVDNELDKKVIFIVHGLSVMGTPFQYPLRHKNGLMTLLNFYAKHLDEFDVYVMPMANPDGFDKAEKTRFWNKNASPQSACSGVALDRNFDVAWNLSRKNISSCSQQYPGAHAFSEIETKAVREVFKKYGHKIVAYLNLHSGTYNTNTLKGDAVLHPKGYTDAVSDEIDRYVDLRGLIEEKLREADFRVMSITVDSLYNWYGVVAGTSVDYASTVYGIPYALELVMQVYAPEQARLVLTELWCRVIDVIFQTVYKYTQADANKDNNK